MLVFVSLSTYFCLKQHLSNISGLIHTTLLISYFVKNYLKKDYKTNMSSPNNNTMDFLFHQSVVLCELYAIHSLEE